MHDEGDSRGAGQAPPPQPDAEAERLDELVDEEGAESFPASDPPSTWSGVERRP
ncbi:MAG: hypothetical protein JWO62_1855 [Acidimicrobiaceae bacterium]|jgi:hypothetical protein|nr:hypothetical protein [Acidimicrobiaceae bacterium]